MNEKIVRQAGFNKEADRAALGFCPLCGNDVNEKDFKDKLSLKEFKISGLCQHCQDVVFTTDRGVSLCSIPFVVRHDT